MSINAKEYKESLQSAKLVQQGLLPKKRHFNRLFTDSFVFYSPQYIISGDFYWLGEKHGLKYLVVGDCTGHGVSAALLSVLALNLFEYTIMNKKIKRTHKILQEVDKRFVESFKDAQLKNYDTPWIDLSIICINDAENKLYFSSANRKLLIVDKDQNSTILKGSKYPVGGWQVEKNRTFESQTISYSKGAQLYLGSDGFQDQIGGPKDKKYKSKKLHNFLISNSYSVLNTQKEKIEAEFNGWKLNNSQTDDVCIVGIKL